MFLMLYSGWTVECNMWKCHRAYHCCLCLAKREDWSPEIFLGWIYPIQSFTCTGVLSLLWWLGQPTLGATVWSSKLLEVNYLLSTVHFDRSIIFPLIAYNYICRSKLMWTLLFCSWVHFATACCCCSDMRPSQEGTPPAARILHWLCRELAASSCSSATLLTSSSSSRPTANSLKHKRWSYQMDWRFEQ